MYLSACLPAGRPARLQLHFGPPDLHIRVRAKSRRLILHQIDYWEGALELFFYKLCLIMIDHMGPRSFQI